MTEAAAACFGAAARSVAMHQLAEACPRFHRCAVNACPLHSGYGRTLRMDPADVEGVCDLPRSGREAIVQANPDLAGRLRFGGLTGRELAGLKRAETMSDLERAALSVRGLGTRFSGNARRVGEQTAPGRPLPHLPFPQFLNAPAWDAEAQGGECHTEADS